MSRHWRPPGKIVRIRPVRQGPWTRADEYLGLDTAGPRKIVPVVVSAVVVGLAAGGFLSWTARNAESGPSAAIEWNAVQAVPTRTPDAADVAWGKRAEENGLSAIQGAGHAGPWQAVDGQRIYVIDGDTFDLNGTRIRVAGIDAPETHPARCPQEAALGEAATQKLAELLRGRPLWISGNIVDRWGRSVRTVRVNGADVADAMIGSGLARNYDGKKRATWC